MGDCEGSETRFGNGGREIYKEGVLVGFNWVLGEEEIESSGSGSCGHFQCGGKEAKIEPLDNGGKQLIVSR